MGPRTVPCGTPEVTAAVNDLLPSRTTSWVWLLRKLWIQSSVFPRMP